MRCIECGLSLHRNREGKCYYCKKTAEEAQAELDEWVATE